MGLPFRVEKKESFRLIGYSMKTTSENHENRMTVPLFWLKFKEDKLRTELKPFMNLEPHGLMGVTIYNIDAHDTKRFQYFTAVATQSEPKEGFDTYMIPSHTWAIFPCTGDNIRKTQKMAVLKWLPRSKYKPLNKGYLTGKMKSQAPDIEFYGKGGVAEIWIAVQEK